MKNGEVSPQDDSTDSIFKKKKNTAFISVLCLPSCSGGILFYPVRGAQTFPAGNIKIYRHINILLCLNIYMSKWKGKQEHWKNMALSRADHWKGVRMKFYWEETLKTWNHKKVFLHTAIASLYLSTVIFHCLVVPLCVYLHLNQPSLWWRTALHVWRLLLGKHHFRIIECLNVLGRKLSDFCVLYFSTLIWRDEWDLEQLTREELYLRLIQQVQHILGVGIKVKNMVCCRPDKNGFFSYLCNKGTALSSFAKSQRTTQKKSHSQGTLF